MADQPSIVHIPHSGDRGLDTAWAALLDGAIGAIEIASSPAQEDLAPGAPLPASSHVTFQSAAAPKAIFPGAFNPLHHGHLHIAGLSALRLGATPHFEISVTNVDKATIDRTEVVARIEQFDEEYRVLLTRAATFAGKAELFPGVTFVVGADTMVRIDDPKYYTSPAARDQAIEQLARLGCEFLVFGRHDGPSGTFVTLSDMRLSSALTDLCHEVGEEEFRIDLSSSELRAGAD